MSSPIRRRLGVATVTAAVRCVFARNCGISAVWSSSNERSPSATRREVDVPVCDESCGMSSMALRVERLVGVAFVGGRLVGPKNLGRRTSKRQVHALYQLRISSGTCAAHLRSKLLDSTPPGGGVIAKICVLRSKDLYSRIETGRALPRVRQHEVRQGHIQSC